MTTTDDARAYMCKMLELHEEAWGLSSNQDDNRYIMVSANDIRAALQPQDGVMVPLAHDIGTIRSVLTLEVESEVEKSAALNALDRLTKALQPYMKGEK